MYTSDDEENYGYSGNESEGEGRSSESDSDGFENMYLAVQRVGHNEATLRDPSHDFDGFEQDVMRGEVDAEDSDGSSLSWGADFSGGGKKKKKKEDDDDSSDLLVVCDFRRGPKHWPREVELLNEEQSKEKIETEMQAAQKKLDDKAKVVSEKGGKDSAAGSILAVGSGGSALLGIKGRGVEKDEDDGFFSAAGRSGKDKKGKQGDDHDEEDENEGEGKGKIEGGPGGPGGPGAIGPMGPGMPGGARGWGARFGGYSSSSESSYDPDEELIDADAYLKSKESPAPANAVFETLRDRSTALLIPSGTRLKLDITGLTRDGLEKKKKAERTRMKEALMSQAQKEKRAKKAAARKQRTSAFSWWDSGAVGGGWSSAWEKDWAMKHYVNSYTITFDIKFKNEIPREGASLFQTSLVYVEENVGTGRKTVKQSDGECVVGANGGVGCFGQLGDVSRNKVEPGRWRRVVVSVSCVTEGKGEMLTWIDAVPCAQIKRDALSADGRFALNSESLYLFSAMKPSMMPGDVLLRFVRVSLGVSNDELVKLNNAEDRVISMFEEERIAQVDEQRKGLSLARLFPKPRPMWMAPTLIAAVGDAFIERTAFEGNSALIWSFKVLHYVLRRVVEESTSGAAMPFLSGFDLNARGVLSDLLHVTNQSAVAMSEMLRVVIKMSDSIVMSFLGKVRKLIVALGVGDQIMLPAIIETEELIFIVERSSEQMYRIVVVHTNSRAGLVHHASSPLFGPKLKYRTCLVLSNVPKKNATDNVFWMAVYSLAVKNNPGDLNRFYDVLIPFLTGKPLESSLFEAEEAALAFEEGTSTDAGAFGEWCSPQRSESSYVRCVFHAWRYLLRSRGLPSLQCKQVMLAIRAQLVHMLANDLQFVHPNGSGQRVCRLAGSQLAYSSVKLVRAMTHAHGEDAVNEFAMPMLERVKSLVDDINAKLEACSEVEQDVPPQLDLRGSVEGNLMLTPSEQVTADSPEVTVDSSAPTSKVAASQAASAPIEHDTTGTPVTVNVKIPSIGRNSERTIAIKLFTTSRVRHLLEKVVEQTSVDLESIKLIFLGRILTPAQSLKDAGMNDAQHGVLMSISKPNVVDVTRTGSSNKVSQDEGRDAEASNGISTAASLAAGANTAQGRLVSALKQRKAELRLKPDDDSVPPLETHYMDSLAWDAEQSEPNPGLAVALRKYVPVDPLQMPERVTTQVEAVRALRLCDRICTLVDNQPHCVKNDRFLIANLLRHTFTHIVPTPKPRPTEQATAQIAARSERRHQRDLAELQAKSQQFQDRQPGARVEKSATAEKSAPASVAAQPSPNVSTDQSLPDFSVGAVAEAELTAQSCIWDLPMNYELQVELMLVLQRLAEHLVAATFSIQQDRSFDSVVIVTMGCIAALADSVMRRRATDLPSEVCSHLMGKTRDGRQLGHPGFGISVAAFATQTETIEAHSAELCIARTAVLDYFQSPQQRRLEKIFSWERHFENKPDRTLIKYLRSVQREIAHSDGNPHQLLVDNVVESSILKKNYPELRCYRDICFWWKCLMNPDVKAFPNYMDMRRDGSTGAINRFSRIQAQLHWAWEQSATAAGYAVSCNINQTHLHCRPEPDRDAKGEVFSRDRQPPTHRFPSTATPSFYVPDLPPIKTEDDVIYRPNLPGFEDDVEVSKSGSDKKKKKPTAHVRQHVLGQHDSELLISYLTVPYIRLPLVLTFFASDDRLHKLQSKKLRGILDSVVFEPGRYLSLDLVGVAPTMVPTPQPQLLATPYGLLLNELVRAPDTVLRAMDALLEGALALDTGSVCDVGAKDFNVSVDTILYVARLGARVENFVSFLVMFAQDKHDSISKHNTLLRDLEITPDALQKLVAGRAMLRNRLLVDFDDLLEDYLRRLDNETKKDPTNEALVDRNSRLAADLHAVKIIMHRNTLPEEYTEVTARTLIGSFVYLTTRHTWNKATREFGRLLLPETEVYEVLQIQRRRLVQFCRGLAQGSLDKVMQTSLQIATSTTGSFASHGVVVESHNRWARISGERSVGRFAVGSTRTVSDESGSKPVDENAIPIPSLGGESKAEMLRQRSHLAPVGEVSDSGMLGVELDLQIGQMTLRSKHLSALPTDIACHPDVRDVFGTSTMQASLMERAQNRSVYRLVGLHHDIVSWHMGHTDCAPLGEAWERAYDPSMLFDSESWIPPLFEPVRRSFFNGPTPPPMTFMMLARPVPAHAEVAMLMGVGQILGGAFKIVVLFRKLRCVHVYQCVSHGRRYYYTLHMSTDVRYSFRELQPEVRSRVSPPPNWWKNGAGEPYPFSGNVSKTLYDDICFFGGLNNIPERSVLVIRDAAHQENISLGRETLIPARFLTGLVPDALLADFRFWRDETSDRAHGRRGRMRLLGYPLHEGNSEYVIRIETQAVRALDVTGHLPSRSVRVVRRLKSEVVKEFEQKKRLAEILESTGLLIRPRRLRAQKAAREAARRKREEREHEEAMAELVSSKEKKTLGLSYAELGPSSGELADAEASDEEDDEVWHALEDHATTSSAKKRRGSKAGQEGGAVDSIDPDLLPPDINVGAIVETAIRTNVWVEASIVAVHHDERTVDVELRGAVNQGVILTNVDSRRDIRRKKMEEEAEKGKDEDEENTGSARRYGGGRRGTGLGRAAPRKSDHVVKIHQREGEGLYRWEGMSDSDDADWATDSSEEDEKDSGEEENEEEGGEARRSKRDALTFAQLDALDLLLEATEYDEERCVQVLRDMGRDVIPHETSYYDVKRLARAVAKRSHGDPDFEVRLTAHLRIADPKTNDCILQNCLYAPKSSRLFSLVKVLTRIENLSHILVWTKAANVDPAHLLHASDAHMGAAPLDFVELPRLKLSFTARADHDGKVRLYSRDHADLFITNERNAMTSRMLTGIPHSLLLNNTQGETHVLVPVVSVKRPIVLSMPFSTALVLDRGDTSWAKALTQRYYLFPVHVSLSFLMSKGIDSALYLVLLKFFHRSYAEVFRLADGIATDTVFSPAGRAIFHALAQANDDWHPDAHAARLKISLVTMDSGVTLPWDLTVQAARMIVKSAHVSASCRLSLEEELQLLETEGAIVYETSSPAYRKGLHTPYVRALVKNRQQALSGYLRGDAKVAVAAPPRVPLSNWPYYVDNTVFNEEYATMLDITTKSEFEEALTSMNFAGGDGLNLDEEEEEDHENQGEREEPIRDVEVEESTDFVEEG